MLTADVCRWKSGLVCNLLMHVHQEVARAGLDDGKFMKSEKGARMPSSASLRLFSLNGHAEVGIRAPGKDENCWIAKGQN